jgi:predicted secreted protein
MSWYNNFVAFAIIYMVTLFCVLPIGVKTADEAGEAKLPGQADSAPANPRMGFKFLLTFLISCVLFGIYYVVGYYDLLGLSDLLGRT